MLHATLWGTQFTLVEVWKEKNWNIWLKASVHHVHLIDLVPSPAVVARCLKTGSSACRTLFGGSLSMLGSSRRSSLHASICRVGWSRWAVELGGVHSAGSPSPGRSASSGVLLEGCAWFQCYPPIARTPSESQSHPSWCQFRHLPPRKLELVYSLLGSLRLQLLFRPQLSTM